MAEVRETLKQPGNARVSKSAPLAKGTAVLVDDLAAYWVRDGRVYAVNGVAKELSGGISYAPPSIDMSALEGALEGKATQGQAVFSVPPEHFLEDVNTILAQGAIGPLEKSTYWDHDLEAGEKGRAAVRLSEWGGELSVVSVNGLFKRGAASNFGPLLLMKATMAVLSPAESADARDAILLGLMKQLGDLKEGEKAVTTVGNVQYAMWRESVGVAFLEARPASL
jgi:hypothetical protein